MVQYEHIKQDVAGCAFMIVWQSAKYVSAKD